MTRKPAFDFLARPPRAAKPRKRGLTVVSDKAKSLANGLTVFTELDKKFPDRPLNAEEAIEMANRDLEAGAYLVVVEKSDVALVIKQGADTLHRMMRGVGSEHLIVECGPGNDRFDIAKWLIREFGPDVNLENIDAEDAYVIEAMRHGLNRAADYSYFHAWREKGLPRIPALCPAPPIRYTSA